MITNFIIVPSYLGELLLWVGAGINITAAILGIKARRNYRKAGSLLKERTKEMDHMLDVLKRDAATLNREIEEVRKLKQLP